MYLDIATMKNILTVISTHSNRKDAIGDLPGLGSFFLDPAFDVAAGSQQSRQRPTSLIDRLSVARE